MQNHCERCERSLERRDDETDSVVIEAGETQCCCGSIEATLGGAFDIRSFHDAVLGSGGVGLVTLAGIVEAWLEERAPA